MEEVLDLERHRAPDPGEGWIKKTRERKESREEEDLLAVLERATSALLDAAVHYVEPRPRRRYVAELKRSARQLARAEVEREQTFRRLVEWWRNETGLMALIEDKAMHPAYQQIIGMGPDAIPLILREMKSRPGHWFWALNAITREDPIDPEDAGNVRKMTEVWLEWGRERGYIDDGVGRTRLPEPA